MTAPAMIRRVLGGLPFWLLLAAASPLSAAEVTQTQGPATLRLEVDRVEDGSAEVRLSSVMRLTITLEGTAPLKVGDGDEAVVQSQVAALKAAGPWFNDAVPAEVQRTPLPEGRERWQLIARLDPAKAGNLELHPASLEYTEGKSGEKKKVEWQPITVRVTTVVASADRKELRDITGPEEIPVKPSWLRHLPWLGLAVAGLGLLAGLVSLRRRRSRPAVTLQPHEWAAQELTRIEGLGLPATGAVERFHTLLCDVVRGYLERRFQLPATHQTTAEFLATMRRSPQLTEAQRELLRDFLERCDMAKFARAAPTPEECRAVASMARSFVQQTAPLRA